MGNPSRVVSGLEGSLKKTNEELRTENLNLKEQLAASLARADKEAALAKRLATKLKMLRQQNSNKEGVLEVMKTQNKNLKQRLKECTAQTEVRRFYRRFQMSSLI